VVLALFPARVAAQQPADVARAKESFNAGAMAYSMGEYSAAIQALDAAYAITPLPAIAFSLAQAERRQYFVDHKREHVDRAILLFRKYLDQVPSGGRRADAVDALAQLEPIAAVPMSPAGPSSSGDSVRPTRLFITSEAPGAQVSVDGGAPAPSPWIHEVEPGQHRVQVSAEGFYPEERNVVAVAGELIPAAVPLREKPSTVAVWSDSDAALYVDGTYARRGGEGVVLELPSGAHRLDVAQKGYFVSSNGLQLERGQNQNLHVTLVPTPQRQVARAFFVAGGVAFGVGVVAGALALHAQGNAQDFLDKRAQGNVTSSELSEYNSDVSSRDRYRVAAAIGLGTSAAFFLTGLLLHELDQPHLQESSRPGVAVTPLVFRGGGGALFSF
jgi:hypothetical protein